jgi:tetratricopeptide (TPR) repeat protein
MQLDPLRWLISLAGFVYDWIITREWSRALLCLLPLFLLGGLALAAGSSSWRNPDELAQWYIELGDEEINDWEAAWAPASAAVAADPTSDISDSGDDSLSSPAAAPEDAAEVADKPESEQAQKVPRFAETLFRRAQLLVPSERGHYVIGATLAQRGALNQARAMLGKVAPDKGSGYAPAHGFVAQILFTELPKLEPEQVAEKLPILKHHVAEAKRWNRCPRPVLLAGSELSFRTGDIAEGLALLANSAERYPEDNFPLAKMAFISKDQRLFEQAWPRAEEYLRSVLAEQPDDEAARLKLSDTYVMTGNFAAAKDVLREVSEKGRTPEIVRALSQVYLIQYRQSQSMSGNKMTVDMSLLNGAMSIDPTNPLVAEEIAKLARTQGPNPTAEMVEHLKARLAEGTATAVTHACLGEMRLLRRELDQAIPHLEQVINRLPNAVDSLNNLAYCLAELHPQRYEEALQYSQRAVEQSKRQPNADYYDTLAHVLSKLGRHKEAVTAVETAIEIDRRRPDFHERAASEYEKMGDASMAQVHLGIVARLKVEEAERIEAERIEAERRALEEKLAEERREAERLKAEKLEQLRFASEMAMAAIADEVAQEAADKKRQQREQAAAEQEASPAENQ